MADARLFGVFPALNYNTNNPKHFHFVLWGDNLTAATVVEVKYGDYTWEPEILEPHDGGLLFVQLKTATKDGHGKPLNIRQIEQITITVKNDAQSPIRIPWGTPIGLISYP